MNQDQFNFAASQAHHTINDFSTMTHNFVDLFLNNGANVVNNVNTNLGNNERVVNNNKKLPCHHIIKEDTTNKSYSMRILVFLPGCKKEDITTKLSNKMLLVNAKTSIGDEEFEYKEIEYDTKITIPECGNEDLRIRFLEGVLRITVKKPEINSTDINIE
jgi:HSP20 family molecular chaperone IbpA